MLCKSENHCCCFLGSGALLHFKDGLFDKEIPQMCACCTLVLFPKVGIFMKQKDVMG
jgi:hypothetical protein